MPGRIKAALLWRGQNVTDSSRGGHSYLTLERLAPVLSMPDVAFISLQYDCDGDAARREIAEAREKFGLTIHVIEDLDTFNDLDGVAALLAACDAALGPPTATLHLAGGVGAPTLRWCAAPDNLNLGQTYCPPSPSVRILMPSTPFDKDELTRLLAERAPDFLRRQEPVSTPE